MKIKHILLAMTTVLLSAACTEESFNVKDPMVTTSQTTIKLENADAGQTQFSFNSNLPWHIVVSPASAGVSVRDIKVNPSSGQASQRPIEVTVSFGANKDVKREAVLSIVTDAVGASVRFIQPGAGDPTEVKGTIATPYAPNELVAEMMAGAVPATDIYVRGKVSKVKEISASYGNATFWITDDGVHPDDDKKAFQVYRAKDFGLANITDENLLKVGDVVTILGAVTVYGGTTPETQQNKAQILAVNGVGTPFGAGTEDLPYTVGMAVNRCQETGTTATEELLVKGVVAKIKEISPSYGNATYWITDDGFMPDSETSVLQVFRGKWFGGENFTAEDQLKVGDEVVLSGTLVNYNGTTPELNQGSKLVLLNGTKPE